MKKIICGVMFCIMMVSMSLAVADFSDLPKNHWAYGQVKKMQEKGIITGFEDGTFRPDAKVTREQFATILTKTLDLKKTSGTAIFFDIEENRWSKQYIDAAGEYLTGYLNNGKYYFSPEGAAVREDMAVAVVKARGLGDEVPDYTVLDKFKDKDKISESIKKYVAIAVKNGIMNGNADGTFNPLGYLTRAEITMLMYNVSEKIVMGDITSEEDIEDAAILFKWTAYQSEYKSIAVKTNGATSIDWGDGKTQAIVRTSTEKVIGHSYNIAGTYTVKIADDVITYLSCEDKGLNSIDIRRNIKLTELYCNENNLTELNLENNINLVAIAANNNKLEKIKLGNNNKLESLLCMNNKLSSLDISKNIALKKLDCAYNRLSILDITSNIALKELYCSENNISSLSLKENSKIEWLNCGGNNIVKLDISNNVKLYGVNCVQPVLKTLVINSNNVLSITDSTITNITSRNIIYKHVNTVVEAWKEHIHNFKYAQFTLVCDCGEKLELESVKIDGVELSANQLNPTSITSQEVAKIIFNNQPYSTSGKAGDTDKVKILFTDDSLTGITSAKTDIQTGKTVYTMNIGTQLPAGERLTLDIYAAGLYVDSRYIIVSEEEIPEEKIYSVTKMNAKNGNIYTVGISAEQFNIIAIPNVGTKLSIKQGATIKDIGLQIVPNAGYEIDDVVVDGKSMGALSTFTFRNISSDHTISATFIGKEYNTIGVVTTRGELSADKTYITAGILVEDEEESYRIYGVERLTQRGVYAFCQNRGSIEKEDIILTEDGKEYNINGKILTAITLPIDFDVSYDSRTISFDGNKYRFSTSTQAYNFNANNKEIISDAWENLCASDENHKFQYMQTIFVDSDGRIIYFFGDIVEYQAHEKYGIVDEISFSIPDRDTYWIDILVDGREQHYVLDYAIKDTPVEEKDFIKFEIVNGTVVSITKLFDAEKVADLELDEVITESEIVGIPAGITKESLMVEEIEDNHIFYNEDVAESYEEVTIDEDYLAYEISEYSIGIFDEELGELMGRTVLGFDTDDSGGVDILLIFE